MLGKKGIDGGIPVRRHDLRIEQSGVTLCEPALGDKSELKENMVKSLICVTRHALGAFDGSPVAMPQLYQMSGERLDRQAIDSRVARIGLNIHGDVAVLFSMKWSALSGLAEQPSLVTTSGQA